MQGNFACHRFLLVYYGIFQMQTRVHLDSFGISDKESCVIRKVWKQNGGATISAQKEGYYVRMKEKASCKKGDFDSSSFIETKNP